MTSSTELAAYLDGVQAFLCRYVAFPSEHEAAAIALWVAHAYLVDHFETSPLLAVTSAEMRSGKTRTLDCLELLVPNPYRAITPSEAVVYTILAERPRPTLLLDEADAIFGSRSAERYEGLRAILNAGNRQGSPVPRVKMEGRRRTVERFDIYGPKAIAGIGRLPDTVTDRSIPIRLKRRAPQEHVAPFRQRIAAAEAKQLSCDWATVTLGTDVTVPDGIHDRAADSWEPLLLVAAAAGDVWKKRATLAALVLSADAEADPTMGVRLLSDIREVFDDDDYLSTSDLLSRLHELDDAPWGEWYGKPLTARGLARLLEPYRISPVNRRLPDQPRRRGYFRAELVDAWGRYLSEPVPPVPSVPNGDAGTDDTDGSGSGTPDDTAPIEEQYSPSAWRTEEDES